MIRSCMLSAVALCVGSVGALAAEMVDNPMYTHWAQFKPGTSVTVKNLTDAGGDQSEMEMTTTLKQVTDEKVVVEMKTSMVAGGQKMEMPPQTMDFPAKVEKGKQAEVTPAAGPEADVKESTETIEVNGKKYDAKVMTTTMEIGGGKTVSKVWTSDEVPGMVLKSETTMDGPMKSKTESTVTKVDIKK